MRSVFLHDGTFVGRCGIAVWKIEGRRERELGFVLAREHWGKGYATEAATAVRDHAVALGHRRLVALIKRGNAASEAVARKLGMAFERNVSFHGRTIQMFSMGA
jgi:RimJ/RimL family protein N-acetyltransferase